MQEHVHPRQCPGAAVHFLAEEGEIVAAGFFHQRRRLDQQSGGTAGRIADAVAGLGLGQAGEQPRDLLGRVELACLLAGIGGEALDQVDVGIADHILGDARWTQVELGEIFQQIFQATVAILGLAEVGFGVEVDVAKDAIELGLVGILDAVEHDVDEFADVGSIAPLVEAVEISGEALDDLAGFFVLELDEGQREALAIQLAPDTLVVIAVLLAIGVVVVLPEVADVFQEQHHQDVVLVLRRIDDAAECVAGGPCGAVDILLGDLVAHLDSSVFDQPGRLPRLPVVIPRVPQQDSIRETLLFSCDLLQ